MLNFLQSPQNQSATERNRITLSWVFAWLLVVGLVFCVTFFKIQSDRRSLIDEASNEAVSRARTGAEQVLRSFAVH